MKKRLLILFCLLPPASGAMEHPQPDRPALCGSLLDLPFFNETDGPVFDTHEDSEPLPTRAEQEKQTLEEQLTALDFNALILGGYKEHSEDQESLFSKNLFLESLHVKILTLKSKIAKAEVTRRDYQHKYQFINNCPECYPQPCDVDCNTHAGLQLWKSALEDQGKCLLKLLSSQSLLALLKLQSISTESREVNRKLAHQLATD